MSKPPKQSGGGIGDVEKQRRAAENRKKRQQNLGDTSIRGITSAIDGVADQLSSNEKAQDDSDRKRRFRENITLWLIGFTFAAAFGGDVIFWRTMMDGRDAERPYVWLSNEQGRTAIGSEDGKWLNWLPLYKGSKLGRVSWQYYFSNFGKALALHTHISPDITISDGFAESGTLIDEPSSRPMPPNFEMEASAISRQVMTQDEFNNLLSLDNAITFRAKIFYADAYGNSYETDICMSRLATGAQRFCPGNEMK